MRLYELQLPWVYMDTQTKTAFRIQTGFLTDGFSTPPLLWPFLRPGMPAGPAALHDVLTESRGRAHHMLTVTCMWTGIKIDLDSEPLSRREVNGLFRRCMIASDFPKLLTGAAYCGVELYLSARWHRYPKTTQQTIKAYLEKLNT